jgi:hypothetical protein
LNKDKVQLSVRRIGFGREPQVWSNLFDVKSFDEEKVTRLFGTVEVDLE